MIDKCPIVLISVLILYFQRADSFSLYIFVAGLLCQCLIFLFSLCLNYLHLLFHMTDLFFLILILFLLLLYILGLQLIMFELKIQLKSLFFVFYSLISFLICLNSFLLIIRYYEALIILDFENEGNFLCYRNPLFFDLIC